MDNQETHHKTAINHIRRVIGQLTALEKTIASDASCIEISTEMYSIMQSMKGLSKKMYLQSLQNSIIKKELSNDELAKMDKLMRLIS